MGKTFDWRVSHISFHAIIVISGLYLLVVFVLTKLVNTKVAFLRGSRLGSSLISVHNLVLCFGSLIMFLGCLHAVIERSRKFGLEWLICEDSNTEPVGSLFFWSFVYHCSKYYEFLDTFLQLLSGKIPPNFTLHVYHHSTILVMTWLWLEYAGSLQFIGILFNTAVHVVMYYYYYLRSVGQNPRWKAMVTQFQIVQFLCSLLAFAGTVWMYAGQGQDCKGMGAVVASIAFNATLLVGFVSILRSSSGRKSKD